MHFLVQEWKHSKGIVSKGASLILVVEILVISFMEASVTYYKVHPFKVYESVFTGSFPIMFIRTVSTFREL